MNPREVFLMLGRYFLLVLLAFFAIKYELLYRIFTPLTVWPVYEILGNMYHAQLFQAYNCFESAAPAIFIKGYYACIVEACVAGAAYFLLLILNLSTPMRLSRRIKSIAFMVLSFLALNIIRIAVFIVLVTVGYEYFDAVHKFTWMFASTILVVGVWFLNVWLFNIKAIPAYTDLMRIMRDVKGSEKGEEEEEDD